MKKKEFKEIWKLFNEKKLGEIEFLITNTTDETKKVVLFGKYEYLLTKNFGSDDGVKVYPKQRGVAYLQILNNFSSNPFIINYIKIEATKEIEVLLTHTNYNSSKDAEKIIFKPTDTPFKAECLSHTSNKAIGGNNSWYLTLSPKQEIHVKITGKYLDFNYE